MGILDFLQAGVAGGNGGLLEFLRNNAQNQNMNAGIGQDAPSYTQAPPMGFAPPVPQMPPPVITAPPDQPSPLDSARWPAGPVGAPAQRQVFPAQDRPSPLDSAKWPAGPVGAPTNANAAMPVPMALAPQPANSAAPASPAPTGAGIGDRLMAGLQGFGGGMQKGILSGLIGGATGLATGATPVSATEMALLAKGIDPVTVKAAIANPELMKTLITQNYGPQTKTSLGEGYVVDKNGNVSRAYTPDKAPTSLGEGHIYNPATGKVEVAYEPADKTPTSALEYQFYLKNLPEGQSPVSYQKWIATKDIDPNKVNTLGREGELWTTGPDGKPVILHKNEPAAPEPMDPNALEILARREIGGDFSGRKNLGRGAQGNADLKAITNKSAEILTNEMGMTPTAAAAHLLKQKQQYDAQGQGLNSEARTTGVREANLNLILRAADAAIPAALEASDKVSRTGWVPINRIIQGGEVMTSDPDLKKFGMANLQLAEHWARAMNPTGVMRESDRDKALTFLSTADSKDTYKAAVGQLRTQIERERDAVKATRGMTDLPGSSSPTPGATSATPPPPGNYVWTPGSGLAGAPR